MLWRQIFNWQVTAYQAAEEMPILLLPPAVQSMAAVSVCEESHSVKQWLVQHLFWGCQFFVKVILPLNFKDFSIVRYACSRKTGNILSLTALFQFSNRQASIKTACCQHNSPAVRGNLAACLKSLTQMGGDGRKSGTLSYSAVHHTLGILDQNES